MTQITDAMRLALHNRARTVLGREEGDTLMAHLPPVGWADVATKQDVDNLAAATKKDIENLGAATKKDIEHLAASTKKDMAQLATKTEVLELKVAMERGFRRQSTWMVTLFVAQNAYFMYLAERLAN